MHRPVLSLALFLGHLGHGEGEQVGDGNLFDVGDVDGLVHLALDLPLYPLYPLYLLWAGGDC